MQADQRHRFRTFHLTGRQTIRPEGHSRMIDTGTQQARHLQCLGISVYDLAAGVMHPDGPGRRSRI